MFVLKLSLNSTLSVSKYSLRVKAHAIIIIVQLVLWENELSSMGLIDDDWQLRIQYVLSP